MLRTLAVLSLATLATVSAARGAPQEDPSPAALRVGWEEFKKAYDAGEVAVVDVRGPAEFETGHIPGARSVPLDTVEKQVTALRGLKKPIVLYCA